MPIGKDSIQKRVMQASGTAPQEEKAPAPKGTKAVGTPEQVSVPGTSSAPRRPGRPRKQPAAQAAPTTAEVGKTTEDKPVTAAPATTAATTTTTTTVIGNVSPEVVEKVTGHPEGQGSRSVQVTEDMPYYLL